MARTQTTDTEARASAATAKDADSAATADRQKAEARMNVGFQMLQRAGEVALAAAMLGGKAAIVGLRGTIPMLELYSGTTRKLEQGGDGDSDGGGLEKLGLSRGEAGVVRKASTKGMLEALEISSITHPVFEGAPVYRAYNSDGVLQPPHMVHFLALGAAAAAIWRRWEASQEPPGPEPDPVIMVPLNQAVELVAVRPGEYVPAPQTSSDIRRYAMRQRSLNPPRLAMLAYSGDPKSVVPVQTHALSATSAASRITVASKTGMVRDERGMMRAPSAHEHGHGSGCSCGAKPKGECGCGRGGKSTCSCGGKCGCGGHSSCGCGGSDRRGFPPARHDEDGSCASLFSISCETRWRIRDCLKVSFCDFLRCIGDELCEREEGKKPDLDKCLEDFLCSFLQCLPDAICPPPERCEPACPPKTIESCHCNFAVGE